MSAPLNVLFIEDSEDDVLLMLRELRRGGREVVYTQVQTAAAMKSALDSQPWDVIIADYVLPQFSGMAALAIARAKSVEIPFILVSGAVGDETAVLAMKAGANDYLFKNNLARLVPAVQKEIQEAADRRELRVMARELELSEIRYRRLFETTNDGILILDGTTAKALEANRFLTDLLGYPREHFVGKELWEIGVFKDAESSKSAMLSLQETGGIRYENLPLLHKDGRHIPVEFVSNVYLEGARGVIQCNIRDISQRKVGEENVRRLQEMLEGVLNASVAGVLVFEAIRDPAADGKIIDFEFRLVNPAAARMLKRRAEDLIGQRLLTILPGNKTVGLFELYAEVVNTGRSIDLETYYNYDGLKSWFRVAAARVRDGFSVMFEDITDHKLAEEALQRSEGRYRALFECAHDGILIANPASYYVEANPRICRMLGYSRDELLRLHASEIFIEDEIQHIAEAFDALKTKPDYIQEWKFRRQDGSEFDGEVIATVMPDGNLISLIRDISERKMAEKALRDSEARLRAVVETAVDGIITIDDQGFINLFNPAASRIFGYAPEEVLGKSVSLFMPEPHSEDFQGHLDEYLKTGIKKVIGIGREVMARRKDGSLFPMDLAVSETLLGEQRLFTGIVRDISDRKQVDDELAKAKEDAEAANRSKSEFLANMSHEIRTPMSAILGFANMVVNKEQDKTARIECAQIIRRNALHLLELINEILDLSKIEAMQMKVESISSDLTVMLSEIISLMRPRAVEKGLGFDVVFDGNIPRMIRTDPMRLRQILVNLLGNAMKFTHTGKITLRVCDEGSGTAGIVLRVDVSDTGIGMSSEQLGRLFRPFTQADESITRKFGGTGLGLTISARLAKLLGGDITVTTALGVGSTFTLKIDGGPSSGVEVIANLTESMLPRSVGGEVMTNLNIRGRVLVVDDGHDNQRLLRMLLTDAGADVTSAENGKIALDMADLQSYDLILMDMQMPVMDGYAATTELRRWGLTVPIIALTANAMLEDRERCMKCGCSYYLSKPVKEEVLLKAVRQYLGSDLSSATAIQGDEAGIGAVPTKINTNGGDRIISRLADNPRVMKILPEFIEGLPHKVNAMVDLLSRNDLAELQKVVHQLRGAGGGYGFDLITEPASRAEEAIKTTQALEVITAEINSLIEIIRRIDGYDESKASVAAVGPLNQV